MSGFVGDLRQALRALVKNRGFAGVAVLSLAFGIGANTTIFTLLNAVFLRPLPVHDSATLAAAVTIDQRTPGQLGVSYPNYRDCRDRQSVFSSLLLYTAVTANLTGRGDPRLLMAHLVTGNYFDVLGVKPALGRGFLPEEDAVPGAVPVAVIGYALWQRVYGGSPRALSGTIELNGLPYRIAGVAPQGFSGLNQLAGADVFVPMAMYPRIFPSPAFVNQRRALFFAMAGRLKPGVTIAQAESGLQSVAAELERQYPNENRGRRIHVIPLAEASISERTRPVVTRAGAILLTVSGLVLLIACGNVANLLLARAAVRNREIAVRLAMGSGRARLVRQLLTESLLLALIGGACGLLIASWGRDLLWSIRPPAFNHAAFRLDLDARVLLFTLVISILTGVIFGLAPALRASRPDLATDLRERGSASGGLTRVWTPRSVLVIVQVALSMVALIGAGLFVRSLGNAARIDTGFDAAHLAIVAFNVNDQGYNEARGRDYLQRAVERASAVPGVAAASLARDLPFHVAGIRTLQIEGQDGRPTLTSVVYPGYFQTLRIPLLRGRDFSPLDIKTSPRVVIVNQAAASLYWPGEDPLGKHVSFAGEYLPVEVIGVARNANYQEVGEAPKPLVYLSLSQYYFPTAAVYVRAVGDPGKVIGTVRREMQQLDRNFLLQAETLETSMRDLMWVQRLSAGLLSVFGGLALVLSTIGIYGVISYSVNQRTREIGIRMAMGATILDVQLMVLREGMRLVAIGGAAGVLVALALAGTVGKMLYLSNPRDAFTFTLAPAILALVGIAAAWIPAMRATRLDPSIALRDE
jgi:macrolide transport system ATP-binding/permease protein